jgi:effector-binding domain-containing protein
VQKVLYGVGALIALVLLGGFLIPGQSRFLVSADIDAPRATVFALVNDMRRRNLWSPVTATDPNARVIFFGPARGVGSTITWDGTISGSGRQSISESRPFDYVETIINIGEASESRTWFELAEGAGFTRVRWGFEHDYGLNVVGRYLGLMVTGVIRSDYEADLLGLKEMAESLPRTDFADAEIELLTVEANDIAYLRTSSARAAGATSEAMGAALFEVLNFIDEQGLAEAGAPISIARAFSGAELSFDSAIPVRGVTDATPRDGSGVQIGRTYGGPVIRVKHVGSYRALSETHRKIAAYLAALGIERNGDSWESYVSDPTKTPEAELLTYIYYPIRMSD